MTKVPSPVIVGGWKLYRVGKNQKPAENVNIAADAGMTLRKEPIALSPCLYLILSTHLHARGLDECITECGQD